MPIKISLIPNGPIMLSTDEGDLPPIRTPDGADIEPGARTALCRCGESQNKPYCDGSHSEIGFTNALIAVGTRPHRPADVLILGSESGPRIIEP